MRELAWVALVVLVAAIAAAPGFLILRGAPLRVKLTTFALVVGGSALLTALIVGLVLVATGAWP